jgi:hypothetical protein
MLITRHEDWLQQLTFNAKLANIIEARGQDTKVLMKL